MRHKFGRHSDGSLLRSVGVNDARDDRSGAANGDVEG